MRLVLVAAAILSIVAFAVVDGAAALIKRVAKRRKHSRT